MVPVAQGAMKFKLLKSLSISVLIGLMFVASVSHAMDQCRPRFGQMVVVVDPYGSGRLLKNEILDRSMIPVAVLSHSQLPSGYSFNPDGWRVIPYRNSQETSAELLNSPLNLVAVIDGADSGTVKAALLRDGLRARGWPIYGNTSRLAWARRDKSVMAEILHGLVPRQISSANVDELLRFARYLKYPVIVKPNRNAGGTHIQRCYSDEEVISAIQKMRFGEMNEMLEIDTQIIVQEVVKGDELAFNGFRFADGKVVFTGVWKYEREYRPGTASIYVADRLLDPNQKMVSNLAPTVKQSLQRLELVGPFHLELIHGKVIDVGARLSGGGLPILERAGTDRDPVALTVSGYVDPLAVHELGEWYSLKEEVAAVFISSHGGARASYRLRGELEKLVEVGDVVQYEFHYEDGAPLMPTVDSDSTVATVLIRARTEAEREATIAKILRWRDLKQFER